MHSWLFCVAYMRNVVCFMEQPTSTILHLMGPMKEVIKYLLRFKCTTWLGAFGTSSSKPISVWSSSKQVMLLKRKPPRDKESLVIRNNGSVTGKRKELSESQAYPVEFGESVAAVYKIMQKIYKEKDGKKRGGKTKDGKKKGGLKIAGMKRKFQDTFFDDPVLIS